MRFPSPSLNDGVTWVGGLFLLALAAGGWNVQAAKEAVYSYTPRVWQSEDDRLWLECGTPECDGSPIDWAPYPWWDPKHPATKDYLKKAKAEARLKPKPKRGRKASDSDDVPF